MQEDIIKVDKLEKMKKELQSYGDQTLYLTKDLLKDLSNGKAIALNVNNEYIVYIIVDEEVIK
jgi:hypothetical protein